MVDSNGAVTWLSHGIYKSSCKVNVEYFPFDVQVCEMKWASWTYDSDGVRFRVQWAKIRKNRAIWEKVSLLHYFSIFSPLCQFQFSYICNDNFLALQDLFEFFIMGCKCSIFS